MSTVFSFLFGILAGVLLMIALLVLAEIHYMDMCDGEDDDE